MKFLKKSFFSISNFKFHRYNIMYQCWMAKPTLRPSFTQLVKNIGDLLEESVKTVSLISVCFYLFFIFYIYFYFYLQKFNFYNNFFKFYLKIL